jgi:hypothetical protein
MLVVLKAGTDVGPNPNGNTDWLEMVTEEAVDMAMVVLGAALEVTGVTVGCKPATAGHTFSFIPFEKSNLKPPTELAVLLLLVAVFRRKRLLEVVAGFIPKFNVPLDSVVDGSSLLAEPKRLNAAGVETLVEVDAAGERKKLTAAGVETLVEVDAAGEHKKLTAAGVETLVEVDAAGEHKKLAAAGVETLVEVDAAGEHKTLAAAGVETLVEVDSAGEHKKLTAAGVETLVEVDAAGEHKRPAFVWPLLILNTDSVTESEVTGADAQLVVTVVLPKVNKLFVASVTIGFG